MHYNTGRPIPVKLDEHVEPLDKAVCRFFVTCIIVHTGNWFCLEASRLVFLLGLLC